MTVDTRVAEAFVEAFELPADTDVRSMKYREQKVWSSMGHMVLVAVLEEKFDCMLEADDILEMSSFPKIVEIMSRYDGGN
jgi:acyl carrier protein